MHLAREILISALLIISIYHLESKALQPQALFSMPTESTDVCSISFLVFCTSIPVHLLLTLIVSHFPYF
jgi:hypothetical protein